ncbi:hypothetical protein CXF68_05855 [Tenacibaculum sp. Bg11-29]|uniref:DUF3078 domain-containing protein n=1 Tax=Tenacibaculum sp. Bg11-29 TaxID=2058306 RepID=UPI000C322483|nr:DUF3078 domain-containing protein [Tenacibaculum sp. Bg11-29]PKH50252.1 hypothetical protein CXF68_05855 [Tenacibaculum sp. Bg11-29]
MKKIILTLAFVCSIASLKAQTAEELKKDLATKNAEIGKLQGEANALQSKIDAFPGWKFGAFGTIGANLSGFNNWYSNAVPNSSAGNIGITVNGFANLDREKYFWRNSANVNLGWVKLDDKNNANDDTEFKGTTDVFTITSLFGYKLTKTLAVSTLAEYRTSFIKNFNDPGYLDFGVGATWIPIPELVVVVHPLNYNYVFSKSGSEYTSSLGTKIVAEYNKKIGNFKFRSNLSTFQSYKSSDLSNATWINSIGFNIWKGIGIGIESGLRANKQETFNSDLTNFPSLNATPGKVQSYWLAGLSFGF